MTQFDNTNSYFQVDENKKELVEGCVQIVHLRPGIESKYDIHTSHPFDIKTGNIPELINVLEKYYKSVTLGSPEPEKCAEKDEVSKEEEGTKWTSIEDKVAELIEDIPYLCFIPDIITGLQKYYKKEGARIKKSNDELLGIGKPKMTYPKPQPIKYTGATQYEIWGNIINTKIKFNCIIEAVSQKHALVEADDRTLQLVNDNPQGKRVAVDFGARLHIPESD